MVERRKRWRVVLAVAAAMLLLGSAVLLHRIADAVRGTPVRELVGDAGGALPPLTDSSFLSVASALAELDLEGGHTVEILNDEAVFERLLSDLAGARRSITVLMYYCEPSVIGDRIAQVLGERARVGIPVFFLADDFGCGELISEIGPQLTAAGVRLGAFRPVRWYTLHRAQHRNHARSVVIDGVVGYTGGFGIADKWTTGGPEQQTWREVNARFTGPAVRSAQATFLAAWAEATGALHTEEVFFPEPAHDAGGGASGEESGGGTGGAMAALFLSEPELGTTVAERLLAVSLAAAERTLWVTNAYFVPTPIVAELLTGAARRGVDVRVLLPNDETDIPSTRWAARSFYPTLLEAGVRIWEYQPTMIHAKTLVADGVWSMVGSLNFDNRSIRLNDETGLVVYHAGVGAQLEAIFLDDLTRAVEIDLPTFRARGLADRLKERWFRLFAPML